MIEYQYVCNVFIGMLRPFTILSEWCASAQAAKANLDLQMEKQLPKGLYNVSINIKERIKA